jgi:hypothetical protein
VFELYAAGAGLLVVVMVIFMLFDAQGVYHMISTCMDWQLA